MKIPNLMMVFLVARSDYISFADDDSKRFLNPVVLVVVFCSKF